MQGGGFRIHDIGRRWHGLLESGREEMKWRRKLQWNNFDLSNLSIYNHELLNGTLCTGRKGFWLNFWKADHSTSLQYQDAPSICSELLQKELDSETQESLAKSRLNIGEQYLGEYMERHYHRKRS